MSLFGAIIALQSGAAGRVDGGRWPNVGRTAAGVRMSPDIALENATVWAGHRYLTQTVAQLPVRVLRTKSDGTSDRVVVHPTWSVFNWRANPELSPFQFKETLTGWAITHGNGVAEIETDLVGRVVALWPIHPDRVNFCRAGEAMIDERGSPISVDELYYEIDNGASGRMALAARNVFHIRGFGNGPVGLSVVAYAAQSLGWARATEIFGSTFFGESLNPAGFVQVPGPMDEGSKNSLRAEMNLMHRGVSRSNRYAILDGGMTWTKLSTQPNDAQFLETMQFQVEQVCRWMGVPPQKVHHLLRMTFNNVEQLSIEVVVDSITPWAIRWEEESNFKLFGQNRSGLYVKLDLKGLLRGAFRERQEGLQIMRRNAVINRDEWRELEDMGPGEGDGGDTYIVEKNMTRLEWVGQENNPASAANATQDTSASVPSANENDPAAAAALLAASAMLGLRETVDA